MLWSFTDNLFFTLGCLFTGFLLLLLLLSWLRPKQLFFARPVLTEFEKRMFKQLCIALPQNHILCQVSFSALIDTPKPKLRYRFQCKVADFVVMDLALQVKIIIELDDATHNTKQQQDAARDAMLNEAGYAVLRYREIPSLRQLQLDIHEA